jgi:perosamine synthetase
MIITNGEALAAKAKQLTTTAKQPHPWEFVHDDIGYNYRLSNINAAVGCAQIENTSGCWSRLKQVQPAYK